MLGTNEFFLVSFSFFEDNNSYSFMVILLILLYMLSFIPILL